MISWFPLFTNQWFPVPVVSLNKKERTHSQAPNPQVIGAFEFLQQRQALNQVKVATCRCLFHVLLGGDVVDVFPEWNGILVDLQWWVIWVSWVSKLTWSSDDQVFFDDLRNFPTDWKAQKLKRLMWIIDEQSATTATTQMFNSPCLFYGTCSSNCNPDKAEIY